MSWRRCLVWLGSDLWGVLSCLSNVGFRGMLDIRLAEVYVDRRALVVDLGDPVGRNLDLFMGIPVPGFDNELGDRPAFIVDQKARHLADVTVGGVDAVAGYGTTTSEVLVVAVMVLQFGLRILA